MAGGWVDGAATGALPRGAWVTELVSSPLLIWPELCPQRHAFRVDAELPFLLIIYIFTSFLCASRSPPVTVRMASGDGVTVPSARSGSAPSGVPVSKSSGSACGIC